MKYILLALMIMLSGCAAQQQYFDRIDSVQIGDSYEVMLAKVVDAPWDRTCYTSTNYQSCTVTYRLSQYRSVIFTFDSNDILVSIYN